VEGIEKTGLVADLIDSLHRHDTLTDYGVQVIQRLLHMKSGLDIDTIVAKHMIPAAAALITQQSQAFVECLNYYLSDEGSVHLSEIYCLAHLDTAEADKKIERYLLEGTRLACNLNLGRKSTVVQSVSDKGQTIGLTPGQTVFCDLQLAFQDSKVFPDPLSVDLDRDDSLYSFYGWGHYGYLDNLSRVALTTMLKTVGKLKNLRRAAGPQGHLKTVKGPRGLVYMNSEQSCYSPFPGTMKICFDPLSRPSK
jgi:linoleate 8R-lipoxygenase/9,12-octadecadienoate 8-hydroperoxide 8R-isomerase